MSHLCRHPLFHGDPMTASNELPILTLLRSANLNGHTPFQHAIACRAYPVANLLFDTITDLAASAPNPKEVLMSSIFPPGENWLLFLLY